jgi:hypothetical protein
MLMKNEFATFFDDDYLMSPFGPNGILFTAEYCLLSDKDLTALQVDQVIGVYYDRKTDSFFDSDGFQISHDNYTAIMCLSKLYNLNYHKRFRLGHQCLHPRDLFFYCWISEGFWHYVGLLFLWVPFLCMIESVLNTTYKTIDGHQVLETDGKLLTWLRINTFNMPLTKKLCDKIVKWKNYSYKFFFSVYFKPDHPNAILAFNKNI